LNIANTPSFIGTLIYAPTGPGPGAPFLPKGALFWSATQLASQIAITPPPLGPGGGVHRLPGLDLAGEDLDQLLPIGADPASVEHHVDGIEETPLGHEEMGRVPGPSRSGAGGDGA
jgi:hypothetical protein